MMKKSLFISLMLPFIAMAHKIEVVKTSHEVINSAGYNAYICNYDDIKEIEQKTKQEFANTHTLSEETKDILSAIGRCHSLILKYQLKKHPAIVINGRFVTYGETDVVRAMIECKRMGLCHD